MTVGTALDPVTSQKLIAAIARTGMEAAPWNGACATGVCGIDEGLWKRHARLFACIFAGFLMLIALGIEAFSRGGILEALAGEHASGAPPLSAIVLYVAAILAGGWYIFPKALYSARRLRPDMNLLMLLAVTGAVILGQWLEAASVSFLFSLALLLESWSIGKARREIAALLDITPPRARYVSPNGGGTEEGPVESIQVGTTVIVRPGERIPLDGVVTKGNTSVNQAPITGESEPVAKGPGSEVFAGTINIDGTLEFRSTKAASDTTLSRIIQMVEEGRLRRAPAEQWVEKFARYYTPAMIGVALGIALVPPLFLGGQWETWFYEGLVVLVIACPCALVISTPVTVVAGLSSAARNGVLIKGGAYLEAPAHLKAIAFDKTGTLTLGEPAVKSVMPVGDHEEETLLANAAALEAHSTHPLARAIVRHVESRGISPNVADEFTILPGEGAQGTIWGKTYWIGSHRMLEKWTNESAGFHDAASRLEEAGNSIVVMWCDDHVCGLMSVADQVRSEASSVIASLKELGLQKIVMITGDNQRTAELISRAVGIEEFAAELLPADKVAFVTELKEKYGAVAMVGDGINDAPAMAAANVSIAMGAIGSDAAIETADIALMSDDHSQVPGLSRHSRKTHRVIRQTHVDSRLIKFV
ncbi:MAG: heavy metal translocating P-type ATPase, partial [Syntrophobacteraceae bacterium]